MAEPGAVSWQFSRRGIITVARSAPEDVVMLAALDAGADDVVDEVDSWRITTEPNTVEDVKAALEKAGLSVESAESTMISSTSVPLSTAEEAKKVLRLMDALEEHDDVQDVYSNFDIPDDILTEASA
jgi:transcriptional/translational regulatory protein YebC/TACO1